MRKILLIALLSTSYSFSQCFVQIESGEQHTMAIADDGTLWGWGSNTSGECGILPSQHLLVPTQVGTFTDWVDVACGSYHSIALRSNGDVYTMGYNVTGQCGNGSTTSVTAPTLVGSGFWNVAAGKGATSHAIRMADSTLWACGANNGTFGNGSASSANSLTQVSAVGGWIDVAGGLNHTIALNSDNEIWVTGDNSDGQLGLNTTISTLTRTLVNTAGLTPIAIDAGVHFSMFLDDFEQVYSCGSNANGRLGFLNSATPSFHNFYPFLTGMTKIKAGYNNAMAMNSTSLYTWGKNSYNVVSTLSGDQYFYGLCSFTNTPIDGTLSSNNIAVISDGEGVYNWGQNDRGNCGNGTTTNSSTPTINSAECASACVITDVSIDDVSACDPATNSYTISLSVSYTDPGNGDELLIGGFGMPNVSFALSASPQSVVVTKDFDDATSAINNLSVSITSSSDPSFSCIFPGMNSAWTSPVECGTSGINELSLAMDIFPNPANDKLNIELSGASTIIISDINGKQLLTSESSNVHHINVSNLQNGIYFIQAENGATQKFFKK